MTDSIGVQVLRAIRRWKRNRYRNPSTLSMNPMDVTTLAREPFRVGSLLTYEQLNPVPMDKLSSGHRFAGVQLDSDPKTPQGRIKVEKLMMKLAVKANG